MVYSGPIMFDALRRDRYDHGLLNSPLVLNTWWASALMIGALPLAIWPAVYVGLFDGWKSGLVAWTFIQIFNTAFSVLLRMKNSIFPMNFIAAAVCMPLGYVLSFANLP